MRACHVLANEPHGLRVYKKHPQILAHLQWQWGSTGRSRPTARRRCFLSRLSDTSAAAPRPRKRYKHPARGCRAAAANLRRQRRYTVGQFVGHGNRIGSGQSANWVEHSIKEIMAFPQGFPDQADDALGIGTEDIVAALQFVAQRLVVLDDAVIDGGDASRHMWVGVTLAGRGT